VPALERKESQNPLRMCRERLVPPVNAQLEASQQLKMGLYRVPESLPHVTTPTPHN
jgi:hypothetical protein